MSILWVSDKSESAVFNFSQFIASILNDRSCMSDFFCHLSFWSREHLCSSLVFWYFSGLFLRNWNQNNSMCPKEICRYIVRVRAYHRVFEWGKFENSMLCVWKVLPTVTAKTVTVGKIKCSEASLYPRALEENYRRLLYQLISWRSVCN